MAQLLRSIALRKNSTIKSGTMLLNLAPLPNSGMCC